MDIFADRPLRAVIYNRCSTEEDAQKDALAKQVQESKECVMQQGWQLVDAYVEAKSGTTVKGRTEYHRLYQDLERDAFDIIVIKSQDRLMRNTRDWYLFLERMQKNRKRLYMYLERKFYTPDDALITGIKAILAEEYSRELSKKINHAHCRRQREGKRFVFTNRIYGLKKLPDKRIVIEEREAEMIRWIFALSANGYGAHSSSEILLGSGYTNRSGGMLSPSTIRNIVRNPIYKGTVIQNKRHYDFEGKQLLKNDESQWVIHENAVPAIVDEEMFARANRCMDERRRAGGVQPCIAGGSRRIEKLPLSGKLFCGCCGSPFYRTVRRTKTAKLAEWKCSGYLRHGRSSAALCRNEVRKAKKKAGTGCDNVHLEEEKLLHTLEVFFQGPEEAAFCNTGLIAQTLHFFQKALDTETVPEREALKQALERTAQQKTVLLDKLLDHIITDIDFQKKNQELTEKEKQLKGRISRLENTGENGKERNARMEKIREQLEGGLAARACCMAELGALQKVLVFPQYLELQPKEGENVRIAHCCSASRRISIEKEKQQILWHMEKQPRITAKRLAEQLQLPLSRVRRRIRELKVENKIYYSVPNGRGAWIILQSEKNKASARL